VRRLRAKLGEEHANLIQTIRSVGYSFGRSRWAQDWSAVGLPKSRLVRPAASRTGRSTTTAPAQSSLFSPCRGWSRRAPGIRWARRLQ
jgi:hypothetical protein